MLLLALIVLAQSIGTGALSGRAEETAPAAGATDEMPPRNSSATLNGQREVRSFEALVALTTLGAEQNRRSQSR